MNDEKIKSWSVEINQKINSELGEVKEKDLRFFRVEELKRNITRTEEFSKDCAICKNRKDDMVKTVETILDALQVPGKSRREYDKTISRISVHMRKEHGFYPPFYFSYIFAFWGLIVGAGSGFLLSLIFTGNRELMYLLSLSVCIIGTYFMGSYKDKKIRKAKKIM